MYSDEKKSVDALELSGFLRELDMKCGLIFISMIIDNGLHSLVFFIFLSYNFVHQEAFEQNKPQ